MDDRRLRPSLNELLNSLDASVDPCPFLGTTEDDASLTRREFARAVRIRAERLSREGLQLGDRVIILLENGPDFAVTALAVMAAGGVAVPLDVALKAAEISGAITAFSPTFVVTTLARAQDLPPTRDRGPLEAIQAAWSSRAALLQIEACDASSGYPTQSPEYTEAERPALLMLSSGTTGRPKGIVLSHRNLLENAAAVARHYRITSEEASLCILPLHHANGFMNSLLVPILTGCPLTIAPRFRAESFWSWLRKHHIAWLSSVPSVIQMLLRTPAPPVPPTGVRFIRVGSAALPEDARLEFENRHGIPLLTGYGIAEATGAVSSNPPPPAPRKPGSAGTVFEGLRVRIVGPNGDTLDPGLPGELQIQGDTVFLGYFADPEATSRTRIDGWLKTGDEGYLDQDGHLFITGRQSEFISVAGEKISPQEIEGVIAGIPGIEGVAVCGVPHALSGEEIVAFIQLAAQDAAHSAGLTDREIRSHCKQLLADHKIPKKIVFVTEMPRGPSGKVRKKPLLESHFDKK